MDDDAAQRWRRRPAVAGGLRSAVFLLPVLASFFAAWAFRDVLPDTSGLTGRLANLAVLAAVSTIVLVALDRVARRALPLVTLLNLSMLFPEQAPSRLRVARAAIARRPIEEQLARIRDAGADPSSVAREILALVAALSQHDRPTRGHAERVRMFTDLLAKQLNLPARDRDLLRWAAMLHDIGKLRIPVTLLNKAGKPTAEEWDLLKSHPAHGAEMAAALLPWLGDWADVIIQHHERYDGTGYPHGLTGGQISLGARIVSVADAYDVMTAARAYRRPVARSAALAELVRHSGHQFDPVVVRAMVAVGAPRLRRAQGALAWLADVPLVATGSVPAATVARVVGTGALATSTVTGGFALADGFDRPPPPAVVTAVAQVAAPGAVVTARPAPVRATPDEAAGDSGVGAATPDMASSAEPSATPDSGSEPAAVGAADDASPGADGSSETDSDDLVTPNPTGSAPDSRIDSGSDSSGSDGSGSDSSGSSGSGSSGPGGSDSSGSDSSGTSGSGGTGSDSGPDTSDDTLLDALKDTITGTIDDTVPESIDDTVDDLVGTVDTVVQDPIAGLTGALGAPSPSPTPTPTTTTTATTTESPGLLSGLLDR